ncbi:preprotein translocase subunit SecG [Paracoccus albus]|uniref:preprotein translocase subunit SecG n=1 Tax=Paracoccus albus TaxID=3017784 RepID=UPI0022F02904|nr:preprotein translocase subunit SecG [Paracoccus albus]WBU60660.1 preprotein translocase subunit SecG [Paracoccus albus]
MENVVLTVHLILALLLIGIVLLQRSEGGGLGMGGGGGGGGVMTGRQAANALSKMTWIFAAAFIATSLTLTVIAARNTSGGSVLDQIGIGADTSGETGDGSAPALPTYVPPPGVGSPVAPPAPEGEAAAPAATAPAAAEVAPAEVVPAEEAAPAEPAAPAADTPATDSPVTPPAAN